jgi:thioredoxin-dependent peroxiredoxin
MAKITLKGNEINTIGNLPANNTSAKDFSLVAQDLSVKTLNDFAGSKVILNIFPSLDTATCAASVRHFNKAANDLPNTKVLCISRDLPFAQSRFCGAEGLTNVITLSDFRNGSFGKENGLEIVDGPLAGLLARAVIILDEKGTVTYTQLVPEIVDEPNYEAVFQAL